MTESPSLLSITKQLRTFVNDPTRFRSELGKYDGLIAGEFVRNFLEFSPWKVNSLLLYIQRGPKCQGFIKYLLQQEGYRANSEKIVFCRDTAPNLYIVIRGTREPPIIEIINKAATTADLNFISWNKVYSLLPIPTVVHHKFYPLKPFDTSLGQALRQRAKWGWTTRDLLWPDLTTQFISATGCRQIGGRRSLIIKLGNDPPGHYAPDYSLEGSVYSVSWKDTSSGRRLSITIRLGPNSHALSYPHTNGEVGDSCQDWEKFLRDRLDRWAYVEIAKMEHDQQPPGFYHMAPGKYRVSIPATYEVPETWDYADDQIIPWFQEWERGWKGRNEYFRI
ncbi:hypothetical protein ACLX1H_000184 [Fusarium chlamydosporum]